MPRPFTEFAAATALALAGHGAPALASIGSLRRAVWPNLAGVGAQGGVALTFDDGPHPEGTPAVLAVLAELGWSATFFLLGSQVTRYPDTARAIVAAGHEVAVHGYHHFNHLTRSPAAILEDLRSAQGLITDVTGGEPRWCRPPYGVLSTGSLRAARTCQLTPVLWTAWGRDWIKITPTNVARVIMRDLRVGGTILLHDSDCTSTSESWRVTVQSLPIIAEGIQKSGWGVRTLSTHLVD